MKSNELKEVIRQLIKEELEKTLPTLIPKVLTEILTGNKTNLTESIVETPPVIKQTTQKPKEFKKYTKNISKEYYFTTKNGLPLGIKLSNSQVHDIKAVSHLIWVIAYKSLFRLLTCKHCNGGGSENLNNSPLKCSKFLNRDMNSCINMQCIVNAYLSENRKRPKEFTRTD